MNLLVCKSGDGITSLSQVTIYFHIPLRVCVTRLVFNVKPQYIHYSRISIPIQLRATRLACIVRPLFAIDALALWIRLLYVLLNRAFLLRRRQRRRFYSGFLLQIRRKDIYHTVGPKNYLYYYGAAKNDSSSADGSGPRATYSKSLSAHDDQSKAHKARNGIFTVHVDPSCARGNSSSEFNSY